MVRSWSLVLMTLLEALKPVDAMIRLMNSRERSTLLCSRAPDSTVPVPLAVAAPIRAVPLLGPGVVKIVAQGDQTVGIVEIGEDDLAEGFGQAVGELAGDGAVGADGK